MNDVAMNWYDYVRIANAGITIAAMYYLGRAWLQRNKYYSSRLKDFWWSLNALLFCVFMGMIESVIRDREETWTLFVLFFASLVALKASRNKERTFLKSDNGN